MYFSDIFLHLEEFLVVPIASIEKLLFKKTYKAVRSIISAKGDPVGLLKHPFGAMQALVTAGYGLPLKVPNSVAPVMQCRAKLEDLPQIVSWPMDGGAYITLPQVYSEHPDHIGNPFKSNLGMYRIQMSGNEYIKNKELLLLAKFIPWSQRVKIARVRLLNECRTAPEEERKVVFDDNLRPIQWDGRVLPGVSPKRGTWLSTALRNEQELG